VFTLSKLSEIVSGEPFGDLSLKIDSFSEIPSAKEGDVVFVLEESLLDSAIKSKASLVVLKKGLDSQKKPAIFVDDPRIAMAKILQAFAPSPEIEKGVHKNAVVHKTAKIGKGASIGPFVYIGPEAIIGDNTIIYPNVSIYRKTAIGKNCIIHSGARIGVDGYGFIPKDGIFEKIPQLGRVVIGDDVEIYANTCISRGTIGDTTIGSGTKIDNLTHIAHNCKVGQNCALTSLIGMAGSTTIGDHVSVGGQAGFSGHVNVGNNSVIMARAGVTKDIPENSVVSGFPAIEHKKDLEISAILRRLPKIIKSLIK